MAVRVSLKLLLTVFSVFRAWLSFTASSQFQQREKYAYAFFFFAATTALEPSCYINVGFIVYELYSFYLLRIIRCEASAGGICFLNNVV